MERKVMLRQLLAEAYARELAFVEGLAPEERERVGTYEEWSARDLLAHNAAWKQWAAAELAAAQGGDVGRGPDLDLEHENARIYAAHAGQSWDEIVAVSADAQAALLGALELLTEDQLVQELQRQWLERRPAWRAFTACGYIHPLVHLSEAYRKLGDIGEAAALLAALGQPLAPLDAGDPWQGQLAYNQACSAALLGQVEPALAHLHTALRLNPALVDWSREDADLASLRGLPEYAALYDRLS